MSKVFLNYDADDDECLDAICTIFSNLKVPFEKTDKGNGTEITYKTPQEIYDEGVPVSIELEDSVLLSLMQMAHERNITFNHFCIEVITEQIQKLLAPKKTIKAQKTKKRNKK